MNKRSENDGTKRKSNHTPLWRFETDNPGAVEHWLTDHTAGLGYTLADPSAENWADSYYDTADWRLYRAGYSLRLRSQGDTHTLSLQPLASKGDGLVEHLKTPPRGALPKVAGPLGRRARAIAGSRALEPRVTMRAERRTFGLTHRDKVVGDVVLDSLMQPADNGVAAGAFGRLEIRLNSGRKGAAVERLVQELCEGTRLSGTTTSVFASVLAWSGLDPEPPDLGSTDVSDDQSLGDVAYAVLRKQFAAFRSHDAGVRLDEDPEEVHDMRVAIRRMSVAMSLFSDALPAETPRFRDELKWAADELGAVRDLDVQLERMAEEESLAAVEDVAPLDSATEALRQRRLAARRSLVRALDSERYDRLIEDFTALLQHGPAQDSHAANRPVLAVAPDIFARRRKKVLKAGDKIGDASSSEEYHRLRINCKKLRYTLEFFSPLYEKQVRRPVASLVAVQDVLGRSQDAVTAVTELRDLASAGKKVSGEAAFVMGGIARRYEEAISRERAHFPDAFKSLRGKDWRRLERAAERRRPDEVEVEEWTVPSDQNGFAALTEAEAETLQPVQ